MAIIAASPIPIPKTTQGTRFPPKFKRCFAINVDEDTRQSFQITMRYTQTIKD